jgi:Family of unknown function (DUF6526)
MVILQDLSPTCTTNMSDQPAQSYANHARMVPGFHYVTAALLLVYLGWTMWHAMTTRGLNEHFQILGACAMVGTYWYARSFPLKAQDRVIRLEEQLRLTRLLPDDLRGRVPELSAGQLIALRFASDAEVADIVRWVLTDKVTDSKLIKQRIKTWRPDHLRV